MIPADERTVHRRIPVTSPFRTLLDLAAVATAFEVERAIHEAEVEELTDVISLQQIIARHRGRRGMAALRAANESLSRGLQRSRTDLEDLFLLFTAQRRLPRMETNAQVSTARRVYEVDCLWRAERVVVELDGRAAHDTRRGFFRDRAKLRALTAAGYAAVPVTWRDITDAPDALEREIRTLLAARR